MDFRFKAVLASNYFFLQYLFNFIKVKEQREMREFIELLMQTQTVWVFVSIILLVFLIPLYQSWIGIIKKVNYEILDAIKILRTYQSNKQRESFFDNFEDINNKIESINGFSKVWNSFSESLYFNSKNRIIYISHRPSYYFNRDSVLGARFNLNQYIAFPNYLIGIGLTFTFIGLAAALHVAQEGLANGSGQQALKDLLAVASIKFISSIVGIGTSILLSFIQKMVLKNVQNNIHEFCNLLEEFSEYKSTEKLLHENVEEQQKHTLALNDMATNIATGIGEILSNQLPVSVAKALEPLAEEIKTLVKKFTGTNEDALKQVLEEFIAKLRGSSADDMQALIGSVKTLKESLDDLVKEMKKTGKALGSETGKLTERLAFVLEDIVTTFTPINQGITQFSEALIILESIAKKIEGAGFKYEGSATELGKAISEISTNLEPLQKLTSSFTQALQKVNETATQLNDAGVKIYAASGDFKFSAESIKNAGSLINNNVITFSNVVDGIAGSIDSLKEASNDVSRAAEPLSDVASEFASAIDLIKKIEITMQRNQQELTSLLINLKKYSDTIPTLWNQYESRFNKVDGDLAKAFAELTKGSNEFSSTIQVFVTQLDQQFSTAIKGLSGAIQELTDEREQSALSQKRN